MANETTTLEKPRCLYLGRRSYVTERKLRGNYHLVYLGHDGKENEALLKRTPYAYFHFGPNPERDTSTLVLLRRIQYTPSIIIVGADSETNGPLDYRDLKQLTRGVTSESI